jgi:hypothetical protein
MAAGTQQAVGAANQLLASVAADLAEAVVHLGDHPWRSVTLKMACSSSAMRSVCPVGVGAVSSGSAAAGALGAPASVCRHWWSKFSN